jgi:hypothetical protein
MNGGVITNNTVNCPMSWEANGAGVYITGTGSIFVMNDGQIFGNIAGITGGGYGSGVFVDRYTNFTMNGGTIYSNTARISGGGVCLLGTFNMRGGEIYKNEATLGSGGGVTVQNVTDATFRISTGTIYGLDNNELKNTATNDHAFENLKIAQYGTFNGDTWNSNANLTSSNNTIKVVNGQLITD